MPPERKVSVAAGGDAPGKKDAKGKDKPKGKDDRSRSKGRDDSRSRDDSRGRKKPEPPPPPPPPTPSQLALLKAEQRALERQKRYNRWPHVTKIKIRTEPWYPPGPPQRPPAVEIDYPPLTLRKWVPPYRRRRRPRPLLPRTTPENINQPLYECSQLKKNWHGFKQVIPNKMTCQGTAACNSKRYSSTTCGSQTGCIAVVCRALLEEKTPAQLVNRDVDDVIEAGDQYYRQCMTALKCYKGNPALQLNQLLTQFFLHDNKYTVKLAEVEKGVLARHPDVPEKGGGGSDLMGLMEKRQGGKYMMILSLGKDKHFLIWGHPPEAGAGTSVKTICYIFDPHMLDQFGEPDRIHGAGAFLRYAGVNSFVMDFLTNYGNFDPAKKAHQPPVTLTNVDIVQKEKLLREPYYDVDLKTLKPHCYNEWEAMNVNQLLDDKIRKGKYAMASLSAESIATSRSNRRGKVKEFSKSSPKEPPVVFPVAPEKAPPPPTEQQLMQLRGENFFLHCPPTDAHMYGRDDLVPLKESSQTSLLHSPVDVMEKGFRSQFKQVDVGKWILRGTRHHASQRYYDFKWFTGVACCVAAMGMLRKLRARGWNEDTIDETLDCGYNLFRDTLAERGGPIRRLVLGELKEEFKIRNRQFRHKDRGIAVWGKMVSKNPKVFDLCRGIDRFFKEADTGVLQIPGEYETAIWNEGGKYYVYHPWPADRYGYRVSLQGGGKACLMHFNTIERLCEHFFENIRDLKRKPFAISDVLVFELGERAEPVNKMKPVGPSRWVVRGHYHEGDERFPENHRNKQATPASIAAIAMASVIDPAEWTPEDIDQTLNRGDILYENTMEHLEKLGINFETPKAVDEEGAEGEEEEGQGPTGTLAAADVLPRFRVTDYDCIETDIDDSAYSGVLNADKNSGLLSLKDSLKQMFVNNKAAVLTARGSSLGIFKHNDFYYVFDPHGCDENGYPSDDPRAAAALIRMKNDVSELADVIMGNLPPGSDDSFNLSPVEIQAAKLNAEIGAPVMKADNRAFDWLQRGTAAILMGPRGENSAIGKAAYRAGIPKEDLAGRILGLPAAAAFCCATVSVPPPHMHQDHMFNFLDAGAEYYRNFETRTGRKDLGVPDLGDKFEMGANTYTLEIGEPVRLPLRLPDSPAEGGGDEEEPEEKELGEGEEAKEPALKQMKELLFKMWYDTTQQTSVSLLLGDYHQIGVWMAAGGKVVAFDPAPTLYKGMLTPQRLRKGDELRNARLKEEQVGEAGDEEAEDEEAGGEGEEKPEPEPEFVPPESCPVLMVCATPGEFIDKLVSKGGLNPKQMVGPAYLYPVKVNNELTQVLKEIKPGTKRGEGDEEGGNEGDEEEQLVDPLDDAALGKHYMRSGRTIASVRGRVAQNENYFMDPTNRDNQDAANSIMGIVVDHIEPHTFWKPSLVDAILKYGDRLHTMSMPNAKKPPKLAPTEVQNEFHVTNFNVKTEVTGEVVNGDIKAGDTGPVLNFKRAIKKFFEGGNKYGVICAKDYCVGVWKADERNYCLWEPHPVGPMGRTSPAGAGGLIKFSTIDELAETLRKNVEDAQRAGNNKFTIAAVKVSWEFAKAASPITPKGAVPDEGYEWKVLTAFVEIAKGRTILRGTRPSDLAKFTRDALLQSAASAVVAACMTQVRRPHLWSRKTVDDILCIGCHLFTASLASLGYEFRPGEDILLPLQVLKRFVLGSNYIRYDIAAVCTGKLEQKEPTEPTLRSALEQFFQTNTHGIIWSTPYAVAVWKVEGAPNYFMMEPHACGPTGLRTDAQDDGAACTLAYTSPKLMSFAYLLNTPVTERPRHEFTLYAMRIVATPIKKHIDPPLLHVPPGANLVPATSKVDSRGVKRRADEGARRHPPGSTTCLDAQRAADARDKENTNFKGRRNNSGWLVLADGTQFLSANHSMACRKFPAASRGNQATACCVMAVAMSRVEDVCRWCTTTLDHILESGDQLYQDSYLHYRPKNTRLLQMEQILRKFYAPGNCVCRVLVYEPRQEGYVDKDLHEKVTQFFREEKAGVFVSQDGEFAVALFKTPRGFYMFDPADRDRYGRAVAPPCLGRARACFSQYPTVKSLADKLGANIPPVLRPEKLISKPSAQTLDGKSSKSKTDISVKSTLTSARFKPSATKNHQYRETQ